MVSLRPLVVKRHFGEDEIDFCFPRKGMTIDDDRGL